MPLSSLRLVAFLALLGALSTTSLACSDPAEPAETTQRSLTITSPAPAEIVSKSRVRVTGTAENIDQVEVNGTSADVTDGQWEALVSFAEGEVTATVTGGGEQSSVDFIVDSLPPELSLTSPERATVLDAEVTTSVSVTGSAADPGTGLFLVKIGEQIIDVEDDGSFTYELSLTPGLNHVAVTAIDRAGNETTTRRGVHFGPLVSPAERIDDALRAEITREGFERISEVIEAFVTPERIMAFVANAELPQNLEIHDITFESIDLALSPQEGFIAIDLTLNGLALEGSFAIDGNDPIEGYINIATVGVYLEVELEPREDNSLELRIRDSELTLDNEDITSNLFGDSDTLRNLVGNILQVTFTEFIGDLIVDQLYDPGILTQRFEFLGRAVELTLGIQQLLVTPQGMTLELTMIFPELAHPDVVDVAGALQRALGETGGASVSSPVRMHTNRSALDRALHGVWRSGLFHQVIGGDSLDAVALPFELTVDGLAGLLDQRIRDLAEPGTPVGLGLRPLLPPVAGLSPATEANNTAINVGMGDFLIDIYLLHADRERELVLTVALFLDVNVALDVDTEELRFDLDVQAEGDLADSPVLDLEPKRVVNLITDLIELVPTLAANNLSVGGAAELEWARIGDPQLEVHGERDDRLSVGLNLEAAETLDVPVDAGE
ncbi:hypothetical protein DL240_10130 [Lujinxingia litoralis]|uniref:Bacterial Ig domain-containing protein n=1 Tax=Lujinxingia litoralis TaxID=2211119 RepID=A0A328C990_9DELT|nr:hypothetical protein [Lujinxingia litoralis]RAL22203.1 hypothetical protein DL240_10130 [Lujinxingia litoralis]